jgi:replicative DNA helicase
MDYGAGFSPNKDFENSSDTITLGSKMNEDDDLLTNFDDEVPF